MSTAAGFDYSGAIFKEYFADFYQQYQIQDMYSGGFYPFKNKNEYWAWWSRAIWLNRYVKTPKNTYKLLYDLIKNKNYFVITTNVDHLFQKNGFDKKRLFYTQGDYGLFEKKGDTSHTYDNYDLVRQMILDQGFLIQEDNSLSKTKSMKMAVSDKLVKQVKDYRLNLRVDDNFIEDKGWHEAAKRYQRFLQENYQKRFFILN